MSKEYKLYRAINLEDGKVYVGATTKSIDERKADHIQKAKNGIGSKFQEAIGTYGPDAFQWEQIDTATCLNELAKKEKYYINLYDSYLLGYNQDSGGGFRKSVFQFTTNGWLIGEWSSLSIAALVCWGKKKSISNACLGYCKTYKDYYWNYSPTFPDDVQIDSRKKKVVQYDLDGNKIALFKSVAKASRQTGLSKTSISRVCRGKRLMAGGYIWKYV